jgi:predicted Zn-dependent peptidase
MGVYAGVSPRAVPKVLDLIKEELHSIVQHGASADELSMTKDQFKGQITLALEDTANRMSRLARQIITFGRYFTLEETLAEIDSVSLEDVQRLAVETFSPENQCLALLGPTQPEKLEAQWLNR